MTHSSINTLHNEFGSGYLKGHQAELIILTIRGLVKHPDYILSSDVDLLVTLFHQAARLPLYESISWTPAYMLWYGIIETADRLLTLLQAQHMQIVKGLWSYAEAGVSDQTSYNLKLRNQTTLIYEGMNITMKHIMQLMQPTEEAKPTAFAKNKFVGDNFEIYFRQVHGSMF